MLRTVRRQLHYTTLALHCHKPQRAAAERWQVTTLLPSHPPLARARSCSWCCCRHQVRPLPSHPLMPARPRRWLPRSRCPRHQNHHYHHHHHLPHRRCLLRHPHQPRLHRHLRQHLHLRLHWRLHLHQRQPQWWGDCDPSCGAATPPCPAGLRRPPPRPVPGTTTTATAQTHTHMTNT